MTTRDLLAKVPRISPLERPAQVLTEEEIARVLEPEGPPTFEHIRDTAMLAVATATGLRIREIVELPYSSLDRVTGEVRFIRAKGNQERCAWVTAGAVKYVRAYLRVRPRTAQD